jgi:hypothetical protein
MEEFIKYLSEFSGYSVNELKHRRTSPIVQPLDCFMAFISFANKHDIELGVEVFKVRK